MSATPATPARRSVLVTGASGYLGKLVTAALAADPARVRTVVAVDLRPVPDDQRLEGVVYATQDVASPALALLLADHCVDTVVHLAALLQASGPRARELAYQVDVLGTRNVLDSCLAARVRKLIVTSSGAAYGYHSDNPEPLTESDPLRGNDEFPYAYHKRLVEEMLAQARTQHPQLAQLVFRPGSVLGQAVRTPVTALFEKRAVLGRRGVRTPFVFVWDQDVVQCILQGVHSDKTGVYNLAGDGTMGLREIARTMGKPFVGLPVSALRAALKLLAALGLTQYGPEQVGFLAHRPVLSNQRLKTQFGYQPQKTTREVFELYWSHHAARSPK